MEKDDETLEAPQAHPQHFDDTREVLWEEVYAVMKHQHPMFEKLPHTLEDVSKVLQKFRQHFGPLVLAKNISREDFIPWLRKSEWGLKAEWLEDGTVFVAQAPCPDHGFLCAMFHKDSQFLILNETRQVTRVAREPLEIRMPMSFGCAKESPPPRPELLSKLALINRCLTCVAVPIVYVVTATTIGLD